MSNALSGTVWQRPNGSWTLQGVWTWDPKKERDRRPTIGTFETEAEALAAQVEYTAQLNAEKFLLADLDLRRMPVSAYLRHWKEELRKESIPVLDLEREYSTAGSGQISTRVQAFLEML